MFSVMYGRIIFSNVLAIGESSAMGLYEVAIDVSLLGFAMGITLACFQMLGMVFVLSVMLYICVR